jgi:hypothetical protein
VLGQVEGVAREDFGNKLVVAEELVWSAFGAGEGVLGSMEVEGLM